MSAFELAVAGVLGAAGAIGLVEALRRRLRRPRFRRATELPGPLIDVRQVQPAVDRICVSCARPFQAHPAMVALNCDECVAKLFEESEERDRATWAEKGWGRS